MRELVCAQYCPFGRKCGEKVSEEQSEREATGMSNITCQENIMNATSSSSLVPNGRFVQAYVISSEGPIKVGTAVDGKYSTEAPRDVTPAMV